SLGSYYSAQEGPLQPKCIVKPETSIQVSKAVKVLTKTQATNNQSCPFAVPGGDHTPYTGSGNIDGDITIDLRSMRGITVNESQGSVSLGPGLLWGEVYAKLDPLGISMTLCNTNVWLPGGISLFSGRYGLVCDNVINYEIVLAGGRIINTNQHQHIDLRNALHGGSNNFGMVTRFDLATFAQGNIWGGDILYDFSTVPQQLEAFLEFGSNQNYNEYAALFQVLGTQGGLYFVLGNPIYTKPEPYPPVFEKFIAISPQLSNTLRVDKLESLTNVTSSAAQTGHQNAFITTSFDSDLEFLQWVVGSWQNSSKRLDKVDGMSNSLLNQQFTSKVLSKAEPRGGNSLGLDSSRPIVVSPLAVTWTSAADNGIVMRAGTEFINDVEQEAKKRSVYRSFVYLNCANVGQKVIERYGSVSNGQMWAVSSKYDPQRGFQDAVPGGFKLFRRSTTIFLSRFRRVASV
ncbi:FAD binding domain-containing protein, partial [Clohesyomyces aquaticus]